MRDLDQAPADRRSTPALLTTDAAAVVDDPDVDVVVEVIGGIEPARELILAALKAGKPVVTGNKELLANARRRAVRGGRGRRRRPALRGGRGRRHPDHPAAARVAGGRAHHPGDGHRQRHDQLHPHPHDRGGRRPTPTPWPRRRRSGYAEADPTADVEGYDAGAKAAIIASIAFGAAVVAGDVYHEGITGITEVDIAFARRLGYVIKLLAVAEQTDAGRDRRARAPGDGPRRPPARRPCARASTPCSSRAPSVGDLMFYGRGAGGAPTASAVLGDLIDAAVNRHKGSHAVRRPARPRPRSGPIDDVESAYYLNLEVLDRPGVLAQVAGVFGDHGVSIRSMEQEGLGDEARLIFITHRAREADVQATLARPRARSTRSTASARCSASSATTT